MLKKELMIKKPSAMIQTKVKELTLIQRKTINSLIHIVQSTGDQKIYTMPLIKLKQMCGITSVGNDDIKEQLRTLTDIKIEYNYLEKEQEIWEINVLLAGAIIKSNTGELQFAFSPFLQNRILNPVMYAPLDVIMISGFRSTYTVILYEFLRDYLFSPNVPRLAISEFKNIMGVEEKKYKLFKDLKKRVLDSAVNEINKKTDIICTYALIKTKGNKYSHIKFKVEENKDFKLSKFDLITKETETFLLGNKKAIPSEILKVIPEEYQIDSIFHQIEPYFDDLDFLVSNIEYANKNCKENYPAYLKLALQKDYAKTNREVKEKKHVIVQKKKDHILEKKNQEKLLKQKAWDYFNSLPEADQFKLRSEAEEKMSAALKILKTSDRKNDIINAQIEKDLITQLNKECTA